MFGADMCVKGGFLEQRCRDAGLTVAIHLKFDSVPEDLRLQVRLNKSPSFGTRIRAARFLQ